MLVKLNGNEYQVNNNEFQQIKHETYSNLTIRSDLNILERISSLINELSLCLDIKKLIMYNTRFGGFLPISCSTQYKNIFLIRFRTYINKCVK